MLDFKSVFLLLFSCLNHKKQSNPPDDVSVFSPFSFHATDFLDTKFSWSRCEGFERDKNCVRRSEGLGRASYGRIMARWSDMNGLRHLMQSFQLIFKLLMELKNVTVFDGCFPEMFQNCQNQIKLAQLCGKALSVTTLNYWLAVD